MGYEAKKVDQTMIFALEYFNKNNLFITFSKTLIYYYLIKIIQIYIIPS